MRAKPGDKLQIPASAWNALMDLLAKNNNFQADDLTASKQNTRVRVANHTGQPLPRYAVVALGAPLIRPADNLDAFLNAPVFEAQLPKRDSDRIAILQEPANNGDIKWAVVAGLTHAFIKGKATFQYATPTDDDPTALSATESGPVAVLWQEPGDGPRRCFVRVGNHPVEIRRARLLDDLEPCGVIDAQLIYGFPESSPCQPGPIVRVRDSLGLTEPRGLPGYTYVWVVLTPDANQFEIFAWGVGCCKGDKSETSASSSSQSSSSKSSSSSESSKSESSSISESDEPPPPSKESSATESSESSESSEPSPSSGSLPPSSFGSDKSTAIVPATFSPTGYAALFIHETPEVRFDDVMTIHVPQADHEVAIDPHFVEVCEKGTIEVCGIAADKPISVGARAVGDKIRLRFAEQDAAHAVRLVIRLTGIRRGFAGKRFPRRTHEQFLANEAFINSAYPSDPRAE